MMIGEWAAQTFLGGWIHPELGITFNLKFLYQVLSPLFALFVSFVTTLMRIGKWAIDAK